MQWHSPLFRQLTRLWPCYRIWSYYRFLSYKNPGGFYKTFWDGRSLPTVCQQRMLIPPETWSRPVLRLVYVLIMRLFPPDWSYFRTKYRTTVGTFCFVCQNTVLLFMPPDRMIGVTWHSGSYHMQWHSPLFRQLTRLWPCYRIWSYYRFLSYKNPGGFYKTFWDGRSLPTVCQQRMLIPPETWSRPVLRLVYVLIMRLFPPDWSYFRTKYRTTVGTFCFVCQNTVLLFMPPDRMIGAYCFCPVCLSVCLSVCMFLCLFVC